MELVRIFRERAHLVRTVLMAGFAFLIVPLMSFFLFQHFMGTEAMFARELQELRMSVDRNRYIACIIEVTARSLLFFAPLILVGWKRFRMDDFLLGICLMSYLFSLWFGGAPAWDRHYLPLIPPAAVLAAKGLKSIADRLDQVLRTPMFYFHASFNTEPLRLSLSSSKAITAFRAKMWRSQDAACEKRKMALAIALLFENLKNVSIV